MTDLKEENAMKEVDKEEEADIDLCVFFDYSTNYQSIT